MRVYRQHLLVALVVGLAGCTMLVQKDRQEVYVSSSPAAAVVYVDDVRQEGLTPLTLALDPRRTHVLQLVKSCYAARIPLQPGMGLQTYGTLSVPVNQLPPTVHVTLTQSCEPGRVS